MDILYISNLSSERLISLLHERTGQNPGYAVQKFGRNIVNGLILNGADVTALTNPPIVKGQWHSMFVHLGKETENGITFQYAPFINLPGLKHICVFLYIFFKVLFWGIGHKKDRAIVCDVLNISSNIGALLASKVIGIKSVGVVTDMPGLMVGENEKNRYGKSIAKSLTFSYISSFTHYVFLTEQMNEPINIHHCPYIVMEALCDTNIPEEMVKNTQKASPRIVMYAGGLYEKYGLEILVNAFRKAGIPDARLVLYGSGSYEEKLREICEEDSCIEYKGVVPNETVVKTELEATLLVNPRPTNEEFTQYSFPSKNMEYMVSGTPVLTTCLPGMPKEYYEYVYLFDEETEDGYAKKITEVLSKSEEELRSKGYSARHWVLQNKNNVVQAGRIKNLLQGA